ncbi:MAG: acetyl-CoA C-acyltransferase [Brevundimonas sp.]|nr:MAG: acetyl-CoA C-acyltransferase [Brevundimonas sp.]
MAEAYIFDAVRTPRGKGKKDGSLHEITALSLASQVLEALRDRNGLDTSKVDDVILGCVSPVGEQGADIARTAVLNAGWSQQTAGVQINRFCASGLEAVNMAAAKVKAGEADMAVGGGVEAMSRVAMGSDGGAWPVDPSSAFATYFVPQGVSADMIASKYGFSRDDVDAYSMESHKRAAAAWADGRFSKSVVPGNSSGIVDGSAGVLIGTLEAGAALGLKPRARIKGAASIGSEPSIMLTGPEFVTKKLLGKLGMSVADIDVWELNEAFAAVVLRYMQALNIPHDKMNVNGGGISMGHPLGATGAMITGIALDELERSDKETALITLCIGGGMGTATVIERV